MNKDKKRDLLRGGGALVILLGVILAAWPLERAVYGQAALFLGDAISKAEKGLGVIVSYGSASPSILGALALSSLRIESSDSRRLLSADRLYAAYDLPYAVCAILRKKSVGGAVDRITLRNVDLSLDTDKDAALFELFKGAVKQPPSGSAQAMRPLGISARRVRVNIRDPEHKAVWTAEIRSMDLVLSEKEVTVALDGSLSGVLADSGLPLRNVRIPVSLKGSMNRDFSSARFSVSVAASADIGVLERQEFVVLLRDGVLEARKVRDQAPFDLYVRYDTVSKAMDAEMRFEYLPLYRIGRPKGVQGKKIEPWFFRPYTGSLTLKNSGSWKDTEIKVDIRGALPRKGMIDDFSFRLAADGGAQKVTIKTLELKSKNGVIRTTGSLRPDGTYIDLKTEIEYGAKDGKLPIDTQISILGEGKDFFLYSDSMKAGGVEFRGLALRVTRKPGSLDFRGGVTLPSGSGPGTQEAFSGVPAVNEPRKLTWEGSVSFGKGAFLEGSMEIEPYDLSNLKPLLAIVSTPDLAGIITGLTLGGGVSFTSDFSRFSYSATELRLTPSGTDGKNSYAELNLSGTATSLNISRFTAKLSGYSLIGKLSAEFGEKGPTIFDSEFTIQDIPYSLRGDYEDSRLLVTGDYDFSLLVSMSEAGIRGAARVRGLPVPFKGGVVHASADVSGELRSLEDWKADISMLDLTPDGSLKDRYPSVHLAGTAGPGAVEFPDLRVSDSFSQLAGSARVDWNLQGIERSIKAAISLTSGAAESIQVQGTYASEELDAEVSVQSFPAARIFRDTMTGLVSGILHVSGPVKDPKAEFSVSVKQGTLEGKKFSLAAEGAADKRGIQVWDGSLGYGVHQTQGVSGSLSFDTGDISATGGYTGFLVEETVRFQFDAQGKLKVGPSTDGGFPDLSGLFREASVQGRILDFSMGQNRADLWPFTLGIYQDQVEFVGGMNSEVTVKVMKDGSFLAHAVPPFPLSALVVGKVEDKQIAMDLSDVQMEMAVLWPLIPLPEIRFLSGVATGALSVRGKVSDPEIYGSLRFQDATLEVPDYIGAPIGPITSSLDVDGRRATLIQPVINVGKNAKASVSLSFELSQWIPRNFSLRARSLESTQLPIRTHFLGLTINGAAEADITLIAQDSLLQLTGNLVMPRAEIVVDPSIMQNEQSKEIGQSNTKIDLGVQMGKGVTVYFPSKEFPVIIGQADPSSKLTVSFDDADKTFALKGNAVLRGGNLFYIQRNFYLKSGKMVFNENQYTFDPRVTLEAELRTRDENGNPVKITLRAENASLLNFQPSLESTPSLSQGEIAALLGSELIANSEGTDIDLRRTLIASTDILPQLNFVNVFERNTRRLLGLDLFYVRTEIVQRWLLDVANLNADQEKGATLADYLDNTSVFAGKYIRDDVFFHTMLQLEQDQPLVNKSSLRLDSEIGFELTTPFFLFDWSLSFLHPKDLFVSDNSFSFTWKISY